MTKFLAAAAAFAATGASVTRLVDRRHVVAKNAANQGRSQ
jgi:hypothetical protein